MKNFILFVAMIVALIGGFCWIGYENLKTDRKYVSLMESKDSFTDDEISMLYHWMNPGKYDDHSPSKRFVELYNQKIKDL